MFFYDPINLIGLGAGIVAIVVGFLILQKNAKATLNILFSLSMLFWGVSLTFGAFTFIFVHPTIASQVFRDITAASGIIGAFLIFMTAFSMYNGEFQLKKWKINIPLVILLLGSVITSLIFDRVVYDSESGLDIGTGVKTTQPAWVMIFLYGIPLVLIILAIVYFFKTRAEVDNELVKKRILFFILGYFSIILGILIYGIGGLFEDLLPAAYLEYLILITAQTFWVLGPILMLVGFNIGRRPKEAEENTVS